MKWWAKLRNKDAVERLERFEVYSTEALRYLASFRESVIVLRHLHSCVSTDKFQYTGIDAVREQIIAERGKLGSKNIAGVQTQLATVTAELELATEQLRLSERKRVALEKQVGQLQGTITRLSARVDRGPRRRKGEVQE